MPKRLPRVVKELPGAKPDWDILRRVVRHPHDESFFCLWVGRMSDGVTVTAFAHTFTGRVIFLGDDGCAFSRTPGERFRVDDLEDAVHRAMPRRWEWLEMGGYEPEDVGMELWPETQFSEAPFRGDLAF